MQLGSLNATLDATGCCNRFYQTSAEAVNWIAKNGKIAGSAVLDGMKKVAVWAKDFFARLGSQIVKGFYFVKGFATQGFAMAKDHVKSNPKLYAAAGVGLGIGLAVSAIYSRCCGTSEASA